MTIGHKLATKFKGVDLRNMTLGSIWVDRGRGYERGNMWIVHELTRPERKRHFVRMRHMETGAITEAMPCRVAREMFTFYF